MLRLFVYGTLKRGFRNFERYCQGVVRIEPRTVVSRIYALPAGYPMLVVPPNSVLAVGTADSLADVRTQDQFAHDLQRGAIMAEKFRVENAEDWEPITGEVLWFDDPAERLPKLDALEDFLPSGGGLYDRVLTLAWNGEAPEVAWTYVAGGGKLPSGAVRLTGSWP